MKESRYKEIYEQVAAVTKGETDVIANMANAVALIHEGFGFWWTGFYIVKGDELVLGPFQGPIACTRIAYGKGVCGSAWKRMESIIVPDVEDFPGHIAFSSLSRSEIVIPLFKNGSITAVLDIDSKELSTFDKTDQFWLEKIVSLLTLQD